MKYTITWRECSILKSLRICGLAFVMGCCQGKSRPLEPSVATKPSPTTGVAVAADRDVFAGVPGDPFCGFFGDPLRGGVIILWRQGDGYGGILATDFAWDFEGKQTDGVIHGSNEFVNEMFVRHRDRLHGRFVNNNIKIRLIFA